MVTCSYTDTRYNVLTKLLEAFQCLCCGLKRYVHSLICYWKVGTRRWTEHALTLWKDDLASEDTLVWVAFHALQQFATESSLCALLP